MLDYVMLIGLPCSGKSTVREAYLKARASSYDDVFVLSTDDALEAIADARGLTYQDALREHFSDAREEMETIKGAALAQAHTGCRVLLIHDQTNTGSKARRQTLQNTRILAPKVFTATAVVLPLISLDQFRARNYARAERTGKDIPEDVFTSMRARYQVPTEAEGFSEIIRL